MSGGRRDDGAGDKVPIRPAQPDDRAVLVVQSSPKTVHLGAAPLVLRFTADDADREIAA